MGFFTSVFVLHIFISFCLCNFFVIFERMCCRVFEIWVLRIVEEAGFFDFELRRIFLNKKQGAANFAKYLVSPMPVEECKEKKKVKKQKK